MKKKYFDATGEIAYRMWTYINDMEALKETPNAEKASILKSKMEAFSEIIAKEGTPENLSDIKELISEL